MISQVFPNTAGEEEERYVVVQALLPKAWKWSPERVALRGVYTVEDVFGS